MGTRGNIRVHGGNKDRGVLLYSHSDSDLTLPAAVTAGLARGRDRWDDFTYLARIIFTDLVREDLEGTTGYGIAASIRDVDGDYMILDVDCANETVTFEGEWGERGGEVISFETFVGEASAGS